jgi:nucleotide-binding universal stress UspA family protein
VEPLRAQVAAVDGQVVRGRIGAASGIRAHLDLHPAGLVALTTHARSGMERLRLGAAAASIVHGSTAPCLVAPVRS